MSESRERPLDRLAADDLPEQVDADVETVDDAVEYLHKQGDTTTDRDDLPKCNVCLSVRVRRKPTNPELNGRREYDEEWLCTNCDHRFDDPVYDDPEDAFRWVGDAGVALEDVPVGRRLKQLDDDALAALAIVLYAPWNHRDDDPSHRDLAKVFPYSRGWIGEQIRAWKDGEYRDLVADPRPWGGR